MEVTQDAIWEGLSLQGDLNIPSWKVEQEVDNPQNSGPPLRSVNQDIFSKSGEDTASYSLEALGMWDAAEGSRSRRNAMKMLGICVIFSLVLCKSRILSDLMLDF